ncbi:MAG: hypothetical protein WBW73_24410, partial [Rhodoplanes sp.]
GREQFLKSPSSGEPPAGAMPATWDCATETRLRGAGRVQEAHDINQSISSCSFLLTGNPCANCKTTKKKLGLSTKIIAQIYRLTVHLLMD